MFINEKETWLLWTDIARSPSQNMAIDEALLTRSEFLGGRPILRVYSWDIPSISIGYSQAYPQEHENTHSIIRRPTGGGIVFHDFDLTYTIVVPPEHRICRLNRMESYRIFHHPLVKFFRQNGINAELSPVSNMPEDRSKMRCFVNPAQYDVVANGKKLAGGAQRRSRHGILHQGSIVVEGIEHSRKKILRTFIKSYSEWFRIEFAVFELSDTLFNLVENLIEKKYSREEWNKHGESP